jgi:hypothetical protein
MQEYHKNVFTHSNPLYFGRCTMDLSLVPGLVLAQLAVIISIPGALQSCIYLKEWWKTKASKSEQGTLGTDHKDWVPWFLFLRILAQWQISPMH